jgi:hypothetical protein
MSRFARHKDTAHRPTVVALKAAGASVEALDLKNGPDLLVGYERSTWLMEVKSRDLEALDKRDGKVRTRSGALSTGQRAWHDAWKGGPVITVYGPEEALVKIGVEMHQISNLRTLTNGWKKDVSATPTKTSRKERPFRYGTDRARSLDESCKEVGCITSAVPGTKPPRCAAHAAEEAFAP